MVKFSEITRIASGSYQSVTALISICYDSHAANTNSNTTGIAKD